MARLPSGVRRRNDGTLEKRFTVEGQRYSIYGGSVKDLEAKETEIREAISAGLYTQNRNITLDDFFSYWIEQKKNTTKLNTVLTYKTHYEKHLKKPLGAVKIKDIELRQIKELQIDLIKKLSPTMVNNVIRTLKIILNEAVKENIILKNPASNTKGVSVTRKATETYHRALTREEQAAFTEELKGDYYYYYLSLMLLTGMRAGEVGALTWNDIDLKDNVITVNKTITRDDNGVSIIGESPKTKAGRRSIKINENIKKLLTEYRRTFEILPFNTTQVFTNTRGGLVSIQSLNRSITATLQRLEAKGKHIERFTSHALRDTFATRFIEDGGSPQVLKVIMGHESFQMTMDLYSHVTPEKMEEEMNKIHIAL